MRRQLGILGILIGLGAALIFSYIPIERNLIEIHSETNLHEAIFIIFVMFWLLFSAIVKLTMFLKRKHIFVNYASLILFISFINIGIFLPNQNSATEFNLWHEFFGLAMIFGWLLIDIVDFTMIYLSEKW